MELTKGDIHRIAKLARLKASDEEAEQVLAQLNGFFRLTDDLLAVDVQGIEPLLTPLAIALQVSLPLRTDTVTESGCVDVAERNSPAFIDGLFMVPGALEETK